MGILKKDVGVWTLQGAGREVSKRRKPSNFCQTLPKNKEEKSHRGERNQQGRKEKNGVLHEINCTTRGKRRSGKWPQSHRGPGTGHSAIEADLKGTPVKNPSSKGGEEGAFHRRRPETSAKDQPEKSRVE